MMKKLFFESLPLLSTALGLLLITNNAQGANQTSTFTVTATVTASCTVSATNLVFDSYTMAQNDAQSNITVTCTNGTPYSISLNAGSNSLTTSSRKMTGPTVNGITQTLNYNLFQDSARTDLWGGPGEAGNDLDGTGTGAAVTHTVYGRIPANQTAPTGTYTDTLTVTVKY